MDLRQADERKNLAGLDIPPTPNSRTAISSINSLFMIVTGLYTQ